MLPVTLNMASLPALDFDHPVEQSIMPWISSLSCSWPAPLWPAPANRMSYGFTRNQNNRLAITLAPSSKSSTRSLPLPAETVQRTPRPRPAAPPPIAKVVSVSDSLGSPSPYPSKVCSEQAAMLSLPSVSLPALDHLSLHGKRLPPL